MVQAIKKKVALGDLLELTDEMLEALIYMREIESLRYQMNADSPTARKIIAKLDAVIKKAEILL